MSTTLGTVGSTMSFWKSSCPWPRGFGIPWYWQAGVLARPRTWEASGGSITFSRHLRTLNIRGMATWSNGGGKDSMLSYSILTTLIEHSLAVANNAAGRLNHRLRRPQPAG